MAALRYFLHQDDLKAGDTGSAAQLEAQKEEEEHIKLVQVAFQWKVNAQLENMVDVQETFNIHAFQLNEEENARVAKRRADRLLREAEERRWVLFVVLSLWESAMRLGGWFFIWSTLLNTTSRLKIKADLEEARIEEEERLKVTDRWEQGWIRIDGGKMHLLFRLQIRWWKQSLQRWNIELKKKRWAAMYLKIASLLYKLDLICRMFGLALTLTCMYILGGKGYWDCSGKPCWLWVCHRQRGESLRCCFICTISDWHPSLPRDEFSTAERLSATC